VIGSIRVTAGAATLLSALAAVGCVRATGAEQDTSGTLPGFVRIARNITLEERDGVINVNPRVVAERDGGFIVSDSREGQIRIYAASGKLSHHFGRPGPGPGEFTRLVAAGRLPSGDIVAADMSGRITVFDSVGSRVISTMTTPLGPLYDLAVIDSTQIALSGRLQRNAHTPLVHVWDLRGQKLVRSFFGGASPPRGYEGTYAFTGFADVAVRGDTAAVIYGLADTVYLYHVSGQLLRKLPVRSRNFRPLESPMPLRSSAKHFEAWSESFSAASRIFWGSGSRLYFEFFDQVRHEPRWSVVALDSNTGDVLFELPGTPKLLTPAHNDPGLIFISPHSEVQNTLSIAYVGK
jgi:hypothetical protein